MKRQPSPAPCMVNERYWLLQTLRVRRKPTLYYSIPPSALLATTLWRTSKSTLAAASTRQTRAATLKAALTHVLDVIKRAPSTVSPPEARVLCKRTFYDCVRTITTPGQPPHHLDCNGGLPPIHASLGPPMPQGGMPPNSKNCSA
eukprot:6474170-Amphidinium_carterae.1